MKHEMFAVISSVLVFVVTGSQQYIAFDAASASSMYSAGNLAGSPAFAAQQALSGGSGYWCSSGIHAAAQSVTWTGTLNSRRVATGVKVDWAYAPGEVKILTSSDGSNFDEVKFWQSSARAEVAFEETLMFPTPQSVKAVTIAMRSPQSWGYFGINSVALLAEPGPFMLVSGITSVAGEQCLVASASGINLETCLEAIAAGDGREVMQLDRDGQLVAGSACVALVDAETAGGGTLDLETCSDSAESGDGRTVFALTPKGQLKLPRVGDYCLTMAGDGVSDSDVARGAGLAATSSNAQHAVKNVADGDAQSYWASGSDPVGPVDLQLDFRSMKQIKVVEIDWEHPAQAFELQISSGGRWTSVYSTTGNNLRTTRYVGQAMSGSALRIRMTGVHPTMGNSGGHELYGIKDVRVWAGSTRAIVQDCAEAEDNTDARDKYFMVAVPEFDPKVGAVTRQAAGLLGAAEEHLGNLLAKLYAVMPSLAACGFKVSFEQRTPGTILSTHVKSRAGVIMHEKSAAADAVAAVGPAMGVDMQALHTLVTTAREAMYHIST